MATTAEGVETAEQRDALLAEGCTELQGFLFGRPLPLLQVERLFVSEARHSQEFEKTPVRLA